MLAISVIAFFVVVILLSGLRVIRPYEKGLVERLGKYIRTADSGLTFIIPFIDRMRKVDVREHVIDVPPQEVITKDNVVVTVDAVIYYQVTDPYKVVYNVRNFVSASIKLAQTNLRNQIGELELDQSLTSREKVNMQLRDVLDEATDKWGVKVTRVEIKKIDPPKDITEAMSRQMKAERTKRAAILEAEGKKQAAILEAEGIKQAAILNAEGQAEAKKRLAEGEKYKLLTVAEGQAQANLRVFNSIHEGKATKDVIAIKYLESLQQIANGNATKVFLPVETSSILGSIGAIKEMFNNNDVKKENVE
jgi:regulator of protease activity HflC (stomatin/prohibitin superfamily)